MKINFETILPDPHSSFKVKHIDFSIKEVNWEYHYHPEVEIVCVISGTGTRHVGYNKSNYIDGDLVLIGKNIPHSGFGIDSTDPHEEIVVQFNEKLILSLSHTEEFIPIKNLLDKAKLGIAFTTEFKNKILPKFYKMTQKRGMKRFLLLLEILHQMSNEKDYTLLNDKIMPYQLITKNKDKLEKVFTFLEENYHKPIEIESIAKLTNMTLPAFCNFFKKTTHLTFTEYLNRYRVDKACKLLAEDYSISDVAYMVGFNSVSYFNRNFNKFLNESPTNFKKTIKR